MFCHLLQNETRVITSAKRKQQHQLGIFSARASEPVVFSTSQSIYNLVTARIWRMGKVLFSQVSQRGTPYPSHNISTSLMSFPGGGIPSLNTSTGQMSFLGGRYHIQSWIGPGGTQSLSWLAGGGGRYLIQSRAEWGRTPPPPPSRQHSVYLLLGDGMPLALTQKDFLVISNVSIWKW